MREGTTSRVTAADKPYGEFYDFYSVSLEYFGYSLVFHTNLHENVYLLYTDYKLYIALDTKQVLQFKIQR
jgi:hypothetical protein